MTALDLIIDLHKNSERQGPGKVEDTLKALGFLELPANDKLKIADLGCGSGGPTRTLAKNLNGTITAVDLYPQFLDKLTEKAQQEGLTDKIVTLKKSMDDLPFERDEMDLIWSEGSIYNIGFERGIKLWKDYLKVGGYLVVSDLTWITQVRPFEIEDYWNGFYREINSASNKINILETNGYALAGYFYLHPESWEDPYYKPLEAGFDAFLERHNHKKIAGKVLREVKNEIDMYRRYKKYYSYGYYIARKNR